MRAESIFKVFLFSDFIMTILWKEWMGWLQVRVMGAS